MDHQYHAEMKVYDELFCSAVSVLRDSAFVTKDEVTVSSTTGCLMDVP